MIIYSVDDYSSSLVFPPLTIFRRRSLSRNQPSTFRRPRSIKTIMLAIIYGFITS